MTIKTVKFRNQSVPKFITEGFHSRFIFPIATEVCKGEGLDIGCGKEEWRFPGSIPVDPSINGYNDLSLPFKDGGWDYIFSSHCLEHVNNYMVSLRFWINNLKKGGVLFLYLPHPRCLYWRPEFMPNNKHLHSFNPIQMESIFTDSLNLKNVYCSDVDLSYSFAIFGEKND